MSRITDRCKNITLPSFVAGGNDKFYIGSVEQNFIEIVIFTEALPNDLVSKTAYRYGLGTSLSLFVCNVLATCVKLS